MIILCGLKKITKVICVPIASQMAILPIMIINFNTISLTFLISNILAIPILGISIIGGYLIVFLSLIWLWGAKKLAILLDLFLEILILIAKFCSNLKLSNIYVKTPSLITIILYYALILFIIYIKITNKRDSGARPYIKRYLKKVNYKKITIIVIVLVILVEIPYKNYNEKLKIYFIDVGQRR